MARPCPSCGETAGETVFALPAGDQMRRCATCGTLLPEAPPAADGAYETYYTARTRRGGAPAWMRQLADASRRAYLDRALPPDAKRVLDFGCGSGGFLDRLSGSGVQLFGVDRFAREKPEVRWARLPVAEIERHAPYDWITLGHVLEHLDAPALVLRRLAAVLAPGGGLWLATPNADSVLIRAAGDLARDIDYPRHRQIFSRRGLETLAVRAGLDIRFLPSPAINTALNAAQTLALIATARSPGTSERGARSLRTAMAVAAHLFASGRPRRGAPELVAILRPADDR